MRSGRAALSVVLVLAACSGPAASTSTGQSTPTTGPVTTTSPTTAPTTAVVLSPEEIFTAVSPALAFIETDLGSGSGVLFDETHLVTSAHVPWPYDSVRVVFPDGTEILEAPVAHFDEIADLAIVDLSGATGLPAPVTLRGPDDLVVGSELYLIGYPGEVESFPQPTLTRGLLSRVRTLEALDLEFLQTDATIAGGQSGGALVDEQGTVIGISGLSSEGFGLAIAADDVLGRLTDMLSGVDVDGIVDRDFPAGTAVDTFDGTIEHFFAGKAWVVNLEQGDELEVEATSSGDVMLTLTAVDGYVEGEADEGLSGTETLTVAAPFDGPYFLRVDSFEPEATEVMLKSNFPLYPVEDPDDGVTVTAGTTAFGYADYPGDVDSYWIDLKGGESITVTVSAVLMDPEIIIDIVGNTEDFLGYDHSSGGGLFGTDARLTFTADSDATYFLVVADEYYGPGGYVMTIDRP